LKAAGGAVWFCPAAGLRHRIEPERVTPRAVVQTSFNRGRNEFCDEAVRSYGSMGAAPSSPRIAGLALLAFSVPPWLFWTLIFRFTSTPRIFRQVRAAAFSSGRLLEQFRAGRLSSLACNFLTRAAFRFRRLAIGLTRDRTNKTITKKPAPSFVDFSR